jgi:hypothetical protein
MANAALLHQVDHGLLQAQCRRKVDAAKEKHVDDADSHRLILSPGSLRDELVTLPRFWRALAPMLLLSAKAALAFFRFSLYYRPSGSFGAKELEQEPAGLRRLGGGRCIF